MSLLPTRANASRKYKYEILEREKETERERRDGKCQVEIISVYEKREDEVYDPHRSFELGTKRLRDASAFSYLRGRNVSESRAREGR